MDSSGIVRSVSPTAAFGSYASVSRALPRASAQDDDQARGLRTARRSLCRRVAGVWASSAQTLGDRPKRKRQLPDRGRLLPRLSGRLRAHAPDRLGEPARPANLALGVGAAGFSAGMVCAVPTMADPANDELDVLTVAMTTPTSSHTRARLMASVSEFRRPARRLAASIISRA